jgi:hypothetical protein
LIPTTFTEETFRLRRDSLTGPDMPVLSQVPVNECVAYPPQGFHLSGLYLKFLCITKAEGLMLMRAAVSAFCAIRTSEHTILWRSGVFLY